MLNYNDIALIFEEIELQLIRSLKNSISGHKDVEKKSGFSYSSWQAEKIRNLEKFRTKNRYIMNGYRNIIDSETRKLLAEQFKEAEQSAKKNRVSDENFFGVNNEKMNQLMNDITALEQRAETAALRTMEDAYRQTVNRVQLAMAAGTMSLNEAIDFAVKDFLNQGINCITYSDGRRVNIADYVRMALRTTSTRATLQGKSKAYHDMGYDTVIISQYSMCSDTCLPYQGKVYIDDVFTVWEGEKSDNIAKSNYCGKWFPLLSSAIRGGLFHPNCRHSMELWIEGHSTMPEPIDNAKTSQRYKAEQKQRELERKIRKCKRLVVGLSDPKAVKDAKKQLKLLINQLENHINANSFLRRDFEREKIYDNIQPAPPTNTENILTNPPESDKIKDKELSDTKSIETAKKYAKETLGFTVLDYEILNIKIANMVNEETTKLYEIFGDVNKAGYLNGITIFPIETNAEASYDKKRHIIYMKNLLSEDSFDNIKKDAKIQKKAGFWTDDDPQHYIRHELGHSIQHWFTDDNIDKLYRISELRKKVMKKCQITEWSINDTKEHMQAAGEFISYYALRNDGEFIAESIAEYMTGNPREIAKKVVNILLDLE